MPALLNVTRQKEKYPVQFMRLFWGANQKLFVYLDPTIQMVNTAPVTQFVKSNANLTSFFARMGLIPRDAKMQIYV